MKPVNSNPSMPPQSQPVFLRRSRAVMNRLLSPSEITKAKHEVARIQTIIRERKLGLRGQKPTIQPVAPQGANR